VAARGRAASPTKAGGNCEYSQGFVVLGWVQTGTYPFLYPDRTIGRALLMRTSHTHRGLSDAPCSIARSCVVNILEYITVLPQGNFTAPLSHFIHWSFVSEPTVSCVRTHTLLAQNPRSLVSEPTGAQSLEGGSVEQPGESRTLAVRAARLCRFPFVKALDTVVIALGGDLVSFSSEHCLGKGAAECGGSLPG
jgi:hypothetical protein